MSKAKFGRVKSRRQQKYDDSSHGGVQMGHNPMKQLDNPFERPDANSSESFNPLNQLDLEKAQATEMPHEVDTSKDSSTFFKPSPSTMPKTSKKSHSIGRAGVAQRRAKRHMQSKIDAVNGRSRRSSSVDTEKIKIRKSFGQTQIDCEGSENDSESDRDG